MSPKLIDHAVFFDAVKTGAATVVSDALQSAPELLERFDNLGDPPLHRAVFLGQVAIARLLLDAGAEVDVRNSRRMTPLHQAAEDAQIDLVKLLITKGAEIDAMDECQYTPLAGAAVYADIDTCSLLLDHGADLEGAAGGSSPLGGAAWYPNPETFRFLLGRGASAEGRAGVPPARRPLHAAASSLSPDLDIMANLVAAGADVNARGHDGSRSGCIEVTALHSAAESGNVEAVRFLLDAGADIEARDDRGRTTVRRLVERRLLLFSSDRKELPLRDFEVATLDLLVQRGADIEAPDQNGVTPLGYALSPEGKSPFAECLRVLGATS